MRSKSRTTLVAEQDKTNGQKQATKKSSKASASATLSSFGEERDEAPSTRSPDDEITDTVSNRSDFRTSFETEERAGTPVSFDKEQEKKHSAACKQMRVSFCVWLKGRNFIAFTHTLIGISAGWQIQ